MKNSGRGGDGQVVSMLTLYSDNLSSKPVNIYVWKERK